MGVGCVHAFFFMMECYGDVALVRRYLERWLMTMTPLICGCRFTKQIRKPKWI